MAALREVQFSYEELRELFLSLPTTSKLVSFLEANLPKVVTLYNTWSDNKIVIKAVLAPYAIMNRTIKKWQQFIPAASSPATNNKYSKNGNKKQSHHVSGGSAAGTTVNKETEDQFCTRHNHAGGYGCSQADSCTFRHACIYCNSLSHGAYFTKLVGGRTEFVCPTLIGLLDDMVLAGENGRTDLDFDISLLDDFVQDTIVGNLFDSYYVPVYRDDDDNDDDIDSVVVNQPPHQSSSSSSAEKKSVEPVEKDSVRADDSSTKPIPVGGVKVKKIKKKKQKKNQSSSNDTTAALSSTTNATNTTTVPITRPIPTTWRATTIGAEKSTGSITGAVIETPPPSNNKVTVTSVSKKDDESSAAAACSTQSPPRVANRDDCIVSPSLSSASVVSRPVDESISVVTSNQYQQHTPFGYGPSRRFGGSGGFGPRNVVGAGGAVTPPHHHHHHHQQQHQHHTFPNSSFDPAIVPQATSFNGFNNIGPIGSSNPHYASPYQHPPPNQPDVFGLFDRPNDRQVHLKIKFTGVVTTNDEIYKFFSSYTTAGGSRNAAGTSTDVEATFIGKDLVCHNFETALSKRHYLSPESSQLGCFKVTATDFSSNSFSATTHSHEELVCNLKLYCFTSETYMLILIARLLSLNCNRPNVTSLILPTALITAASNHQQQMSCTLTLPFGTKDVKMSDIREIRAYVLALQNSSPSSSAVSSYY